MYDYKCILNLVIMLLLVAECSLRRIPRFQMRNFKYCRSRSYCKEAFDKFKVITTFDEACRRLHMYLECSKAKGPKFCINSLNRSWNNLRCDTSDGSSLKLNISSYLPLIFSLISLLWQLITTAAH